MAIGRKFQVRHIFVLSAGLVRNQLVHKLTLWIRFSHEIVPLQSNIIHSQSVSCHPSF